MSAVLLTLVLAQLSPLGLSTCPGGDVQRRVMFGWVPSSPRLWQGSLRKPNDLDNAFCAGVIIHFNWVLTAGHCLKEPILPVFFYGSKNLDQQHPAYANDKLVHGLLDIGLLKMQQPFADATILSRESWYFLAVDELNCTRLCGWGLKEPDQEGQPTYQPREIHCVDYFRTYGSGWCQAHFPRANIADAEMCSRAKPESEIESQPWPRECRGDSGSGVVRLDPPRPVTLIGIHVAGGTDCFDSRAADIHVQISAVSAWIGQQMRRYDPAGGSGRLLPTTPRPRDEIFAARLKRWRNQKRNRRKTQKPKRFSPGRKRPPLKKNKPVGK